MNRQRVFDALFVIAATCIGAWLRLRQLGVPCFWLDEIIHYDAATGAMRQSFWQWLAISQPENGPLFYATQLAARLVLPMEASARLAPAICGIAAIPVMWLAARSIASHRAAAYAATLLLALSPLHVYYSREGRPYALVVVIAAALLAVLLHGGSLRAAIPILLAAFYATAIVAPLIFSVAVAAVLIRQWRIAIASAACAILIALCYQPGIREGAGQFPRFSVLLDAFSVTGLDVTRAHRTAYVFAVLAIIGAIALAMRSRNQAIAIITLATLPSLIPIIAAWRMRPYFAVRYAITALPAYLLLVAIGVAALLSFLRDSRVQIGAIIAAAALLCSQGWHAALNEPFRKLDWRIIAKTIARFASADDRIIAAHHWSAYCLGFYLRPIAPRLQIIDAKGFPQPDPTTRTWIVVAQDPNGTFTPWACRFPTVLGSPIENFHLHVVGIAGNPRRVDEAGGAYLDEISVWRGRGGRPLPRDFDREKLAQLFSRLALEPHRAIDELTSGRVTLANLVTTVADDSFCDDDQTFLRKVFRAALDREITESERRDLTAQLQRGVSRDTIAWKLGDSLLR